MRALFRARKQSEIGRRGFCAQIFVCNSVSLSISRRMAATANRSANESSPFARMMLVYLHDSTACDFSSRETFCARSRKIFSPAASPHRILHASIPRHRFFSDELKKLLLRDCCFAKNEIGLKQRDKDSIYLTSFCNL